MDNSNQINSDTNLSDSKKVMKYANMTDEEKARLQLNNSNLNTTSQETCLSTNQNSKKNSLDLGEINLQNQHQECQLDDKQRSKIIDPLTNLDQYKQTEQNLQNKSKKQTKNKQNSDKKLEPFSINSDSNESIDEEQDSDQESFKIKKQAKKLDITGQKRAIELQGKNIALNSSKIKLEQEDINQNSVILDKYEQSYHDSLVIFNSMEKSNSKIYKNYNSRIGCDNTYNQQYNYKPKRKNMCGNECQDCAAKACTACIYVTCEIGCKVLIGSCLESICK